jgi:hypothetical protein
VARRVIPPPGTAIQHLKMAICLSQMGDHVGALSSYRLALDSFLADRRSWLNCSRPDWLVFSAVLAGLPAAYALVRAELEAYWLLPGGSSLIASQAFAVSGLMSGEDMRALSPLDSLMRHPEVAWTVGFCRAVRGIVERRPADLDEGLRELLAAHRGQVRLGLVAWAPEGYLCLPAMALGMLAPDRGLALQVESEYLAPEYLAYLRHLAAGQRP